MLGAIVLLTGAVEPAAQQTQGQDPDRSIILPAANRMPDKNDQMLMQEKQAKQQSFEVVNAERKKELSEESNMLLTLAMSLKAEVDKTDKDTLSLSVIRKADEIEKLAHSVKEKMKLTVGGS